VVRIFLHLVGAVWRVIDVAVLATRPDLLRAYFALTRARFAKSPYVWPRAYRDVASVKASGQSLDELVYGEVPLFVGVLLLWLARVRSGSRVVDVGAGRGRLLLAARRLDAEATGYELVQEHVLVAARPLAQAGAKLEAQDALQADYADVDCAFVNWTGFSRSTIARLVERFESLAPNARVVAVSHAIDHAAFDLERTLYAPFTWGPDWVRIYRRR
jgi:SAM-dependent methyltransferase